VASAADYAACARLIRHGSRSFHAAGLLLPPAIRRGAHAIYAFCRLSDDAADGDVSGVVTEADPSAALARLYQRIDAIYRGAPEPSAIDRALADTIARHAIPRAAFEGLLEGLSWDQTDRRYETLAELQAYAARVAGTVGILTAALMDVRDPARLARACDLGVAMQLTNIARDVGEDARAGRLYLPQAWLREEGLDPEAWLAAPAFSPAIARVTQRLLAAADRLYQRADSGIARLPAGCRPAILAARRLYAAIGHRLAATGLDSISGRAVVPLGRKLLLLGGAWRDALVWSLKPGSPELMGAPPLAATRYLVEAASVPGAPGLDALPASLLPWDVADRNVSWVMDLFQDLGQRDRRASGRPPARTDILLAAGR
jgi:phytoene synthase